MTAIQGIGDLIFYRENAGAVTRGSVGGSSKNAPTQRLSLTAAQVPKFGIGRGSGASERFDSATETETTKYSKLYLSSNDDIPGMGRSIRVN